MVTLCLHFTIDMALIKLLIVSLTYYELIVRLDALTCPKGQKLTRSSRHFECGDCKIGTYNPEENSSQQCEACTVCDRESGSIVKKHCTMETNTECQCLSGFVPIDSDFSTCECPIGFGKLNGDCSKCKEGYFNTNINSPCQKWRECKSAGVKRAGNNTSDVVCNEKKSNVSVSTTPTSDRIVSVVPRLTSQRPHEGDQTQKMQTTSTTSTTTTTSVSEPTASTPKDMVQPLNPSNGGNYIGVALICAIVALLLLTAVSHKLCIKKQPIVKKNESYRRPVEECGDDSQVSLKQNPVEP